MKEKFQHNVDTVASHIDETFSKVSIERYFPKRWQEIQRSTNVTIKRIKIAQLTLNTWDTTLITLCRLIKEEIRKRLLCCLGTWALVKENNLCSVKAVDGQHCMKGKSFDHQL